MSRITETMTLIEFPKEAAEYFEEVYSKIENDADLMARLEALEALYYESFNSEELENKLTSVKLPAFTDVAVKIPSHEVNTPPKFHIRVSKKEQIPDNLENVENLYLPLNIDENSVESLKNSGVNLGIEVPRGIFGNEKAVEKLL